jgi:hypothetical protein
VLGQGEVNGKSVAGCFQYPGRGLHREVLLRRSQLCAGYVNRHTPTFPALGPKAIGQGDQAK